MRRNLFQFKGFNFGLNPALWLAREWPQPQLKEEFEPSGWPPVRACQSVDGQNLSVVVSANACPCFSVGFDYRYSFSGISGLFTVPFISPGVWGMTYATVTLTQYDTTDESCSGTILDEWTTSTGLNIGCNSLTGRFDASITTGTFGPGFDGSILTVSGVRYGQFGANTNTCGGSGVAGAGGGISITV